MQFLEQLIDTIPNPIFFKQVNGVYQGCNRAFCEYTGLDKEDILGKTARQIYPEDLADIYEENDQQVFNSPDIRMYETSFLNAKKERRDVIIYKNPFTHFDGSVAGLLGVIVDITERKQAEDALKESEDRFRRLVEMSPDGIAIHCEGKVVFANSAMARIVGASPEALIGQDAASFVHPDDRGEVTHRMRMVSEHQRPVAASVPAQRQVENVMVSAQHPASTPTHTPEFKPQTNYQEDLDIPTFLRNRR